MIKKTKKRAGKRARKQTSDRVSAIAGKWLREFGRQKIGPRDMVAIGSRELKALCGSVLAQDEARGKRPR
jgi:hypothetical protein